MTPQMKRKGVLRESPYSHITFSPSVHLIPIINDAGLCYALHFLSSEKHETQAYIIVGKAGVYSAKSDNRLSFPVSRLESSLRKKKRVFAPLASSASHSECCVLP